MNRYHPSRTSHNGSFLFVCFFVSLRLSGRLFCPAASFCILCVCVFVYLPVRELEIEPCNKRCAFPDRIAGTLTSFTAALPKKTKTDVTPNAVLLLPPHQKNISGNGMHLIIIALVMVIMKTEMVAVVVSPFYFFDNSPEYILIC